MLDHCCNHTVIHTLLPGSILITGLLGSWHCVGMCGGLIVAVCPTGKDQVRYHFGRLLGYIILGTLAGSIGMGLGHYATSPWTWAIKISLAALLILNGVWAFTGKSPHLSLFKSRLASHIPATPFWTGLGAIGLPCGWLYSIVLSLTLLQTPAQSALVMSCFWLGTLPALAASTSLLRLLSRQFSPLMPKLMGGLLIVAGIATILKR